MTSATHLTQSLPILIRVKVGGSEYHNTTKNQINTTKSKTNRERGGGGVGEGEVGRERERERD